MITNNDGMSEFKLAATLQISVKEAKDLIKVYFEAFPRIGNKLRNLGMFAVKHGYIMTCDPFRRKRYYPYWAHNREHIETHVSGIQYNAVLGSIERTGKNTPKYKWDIVL